MDRRGFIKRLAAAVSGAFFLNAADSSVSNADLLAIGAKEVAPKRKLTGNPIVDLFYTEIDSYPEGSVAHSVATVETEWDPYNEGLVLKAVSCGQNNRALYMVGAVDGESFKADLAYRREFVGGVLERLREEWARKRTKWVRAQSIPNTALIQSRNVG